MHPELVKLIGLDGRVACVTGAARGIGRAVAERLAQAGASLVLIDLNPALLQEAVEAIREMGGAATSVVADLAHLADIERVLAETVQNHDRLDILVNNAAILIPEPVLAVDEGNWQRVIDLDLKGVFFASQVAARHMVKAGQGGAIVNVASQGYLVPNVGMSTYAAAKGGVVALTRAFAKELGPHNIRVNAVSPGSVSTAGSLETRAKMRAMSADGLQVGVPAAVRSLLNRPASAEEIANAVFFLASDLAAFVTGTVLAVDGGFAIL